MSLNFRVEVIENDLDDALKIFKSWNKKRGFTREIEARSPLSKFAHATSRGQRRRAKSRRARRRLQKVQR